METSLKNVMEILKIKLRMFWFIDSDDHFRIEHEKYFRDYASQLDLTSAGYVTQKPEVDKREYTYDLSDISIQSTYSESNQFNEDWIAYPIKFTQKTSNTVRNIGVASLTTDFKYVHENPSKASNAGYMLLRMIHGTSQELLSIDESTLTAGSFYLNAKLGWAFVLKNYHTYYADADTGLINNAGVTFDYVKDYLTQEGVKFKLTSLINWKKPVTLIKGLGWISEAEYDPETGWISINVRFNPYL
jgi:hypothetical protein